MIVIAANTRQAEQALARIEQALQKTKSAGNNMSQQFSKVGNAMSSAFKIGAAAAAVVGTAIGVVAVKSVNAAVELQNLRIRLDALTGSSEGGAAALEAVRRAAEKLPFDLENIAQASASLVTVSRDSAQLEKNIQLAADIAAASGLTMQEASAQLQRAFSGGAAAADMFRERGILAAAGFQQGVSYSVEETRKKFEEYGQKIEGVSNRINNTFTGAMSQMQDQLYKLQVAFGEPINQALATSINLLVEDIAKASGGNIQFAETLGINVANGIAGFIDGVAAMIDYVTAVYNIFKPLIDILKQAALIVGDILVRAFGVLANAIGLALQPIAMLTDSLGLTNGLGKVIEGLRGSFKTLATEGLEGLGKAGEEALGAVAGATTNARDTARRYTDAIREGTKAFQEQKKAQQDTGGGPVAFDTPEIQADRKIVTEANKIKDHYLKIQQSTATEAARIQSELAQEIIKINEYTDSAITHSGITRQQLLEASDAAYREKIRQATMTGLEQAKWAMDQELELLKIAKDEGIRTEEEYQQQKAILQANYRSQEIQAEIQLLNVKRNLREQELQLETARYREQLSGMKNILGERMFSDKKAEQIAIEASENKRKYEEQTTKFLIDQGAKAFEAFGTQSKSAFEAFKAFKIAQAIMNTYEAATGAYASLAPIPFVGPVLGGIAAAAAVAAGMAQVQQIRSLTYSGRALGGPVLSGQSYMVGERGPELFTPSTSGQITRNQDLPQGDVTVNFSIIANDTTGFDELLSSRQGLIKQIISDAMLERGQRSMM